MSPSTLRIRPWHGLSIGLACLSLAVFWRLSASTAVATVTDQTLFDLPVETLNGQAASLAPYRGRVALVVNVASECGLAYQYPGLEALYQRYRDRGFVILAFPSDDFWQEPRDNAGIAEMCDARGVTFPVFGRSHVRGGSRSPVYAFLAETGEAPIWNFAKYLVGRDGRPRAFFGSLIGPDSAELASAIERALAESDGLHADRD